MIRPMMTPCVGMVITSGMAEIVVRAVNADEEFERLIRL